MEPMITDQVRFLGETLAKKHTVIESYIDEDGQPAKREKVILPMAAGANLLATWPHILKLSDLPDAQAVANLYLSLEPEVARKLPIEAYCYAAKISPGRVFEMLTAVLVRQGANAMTLITAVWTPRLVEKSVEMGLRDDGVKDREMMYKATGFLPTPKGSQTIVNVSQNATVAPTIVQAPSPESTISRLAAAFNEARGLPPPQEAIEVSSSEEEPEDVLEDQS
jgi:hypothetical protein